MGFSQRRSFPGFGCLLCEKEIALSGLNYSESGQGCLPNQTQPHLPEASISLTKSIHYISEQCFAAWQPCSTVEHVYSLASRTAVGWNPEFTPSGMCSEKPHYSKDICLPCCNITDYGRLSLEISLPNQPGSL